MSDPYATDEASGKGWRFLLGDSCERLAEVEAASVHLSVYSPPFASLYVYSDSLRDLGNSADWPEFFEHYRYIIRENLRVTVPGRMAAVHVAQIPITKALNGYTGLHDFRGAVIRAYVEEGWIYFGEITVDKDPQAQATARGERGVNIELRPKDIARFQAKVQPQAGCWVWPGRTNNKGYGVFYVYRDGAARKLLAHRVAHFLASGEDITNLVVRHDCDNPPCCNPSHLRSGTQADNMRDSIERKRANFDGLAKGYERQAKRLREKLIAQEKRCPVCEIVKPLDAFHRARGAVDGRQGWCKDCRSQQLREAWQNDPDFRNRELARKRERRAAQPKVEKPPRTHCFKAHEMSPDNTGPRGQCKQCARDRARRAQQRKRANDEAGGLNEDERASERRRRMRRASTSGISAA